MPSPRPSLARFLLGSLALASCTTSELRDYALPDQFHAYYTSSDGEVENGTPALAFDHELTSLAFGLSWDLAPRPARERGITRGDLAALLQELRTSIAQAAATPPVASAPEPEPPPESAPPLAETLLVAAEPPPEEPPIEEPPPVAPEEVAPPPLEEPSPSEAAEAAIEPPPEEPPAAEVVPVEASLEEPPPPPALQPATFPVIPATSASGGWSTQGALVLAFGGVAALAAALWITGSVRRRTG